MKKDDNKHPFDKKVLGKLVPAAVVIAAVAAGVNSGSEGNSITTEIKNIVDSQDLGSLLKTAYFSEDTENSSDVAEEEKSEDTKKDSSKKKSSKKSKSKKKGGIKKGSSKTLPAKSDAASGKGQGSTTTPTTEVPADGYKDGIYQGSGTGFGGTIIVQVTVAGGQITSIDILSAAGETGSYLASARGVISSIIAAQSPNVDAVSGATYSSNGIISAVQNALSQAANDGTGTEETPSETPSPTPEITPAVLPDPGEDDGKSTYKDGTYEGQAEGFSGPVSVKITIKNGKIKKVTNTNTDTKEFFDKAWSSIKEQIISKQSVSGIDTVSGATYSSNGILQAAQNALSKAKVKGGKITPVPTTKPEKTPTPKPQNTPKPEKPEENVTYKDGTYEGQAEGFSGTVTVKVTVKNGKIKKITNTNTDTKEFFSKAWGTIKDQVISSQSVSGIDAVSGATYSSNGILQAIQNALSKAAGKPDKITPTVTPKPEKTPVPVKTPVPGNNTTPEEPGKEAVEYEDGVYEGQAEGFDGIVTVKVTVKNGKITKLTNTNTDTEEFFNKAWNTIQAQILSNQSAAGIDAVSGATYSSNGILEAVSKALSQAKKESGGVVTPQPTNTPDNDNTDTPSHPQVTPTPADTPSDPQITITPTPTDTPLSPEVPTLKDGVYSASARGYSGMVTITLTVKDGKITEITNTNSDTRSFFNKAWRKIQPKILEKQSAEGIDTVSGATFSSNGILNASKLAISQAENTVTPEPTAVPEPTKTPEISEAPDPTKTPEVSEAPKPTKIPEVSEAPKPTKAPEVSETPKPTKAPEVSEAPDPTKTPEISEIPEPTKTPEISENPKPTKAPEVSEAPEPTNAPEVSEAPEPTKAPEITEIPEPTETPKPTEVPSSGYVDGTYSGTGFGNDGPDSVEVTITISGGQIVSAVYDTSDDEEFFGPAWDGILGQILGKQSAEGIDTVSGSTYSSQGIIEAFKNALQQAKGANE